MKQVIIFICCAFYCGDAFAQGVANEQVLDDLENSHAVRQISGVPESRAGKRPRRSVAEVHNSEAPKAPVPGNLPIYARRTLAVEEHEVPTVIPKNTDFNQHADLRRGDVLEAIIVQNLAGTNGSKAPVEAQVTEGRFRGAKLLGEATLDQSTKRVDVTFTTLRPADSKSIYSMTGVLMSDDGVMGLEGEYESNYWGYFFASALTNAISGYSQSTVATTQTAFGPYGAVPSADTFAKSGVAAGLTDSSNKLRDRMNSAPEKTTVRGPIFVKITVM